MNAALAVAILRHQAALAVPDGALAAGIDAAVWPARLQRLSPGPLTGSREVWLDGGHNPSAARQVAGFARQSLSDGRPLHLVFASLTSKEPVAMLEPFRGVAGNVHCVAITDHACHPPEALAELARSRGFDADAHATVADALDHAPAEARVLIFGSLYLAGEVLAANDELPN